jgi:hypothetical protein
VGTQRFIFFLKKLVADVLVKIETLPAAPPSLLPPPFFSPPGESQAATQFTTQFTRCSGTKVQILTQQSAAAKFTPKKRARVEEDAGGGGRARPGDWDCPSCGASVFFLLSFFF